MNETAKPLPNNLEAERAILGAIALTDSAPLEVFPVLPAEQFFLGQHRLIYRCMQLLASTGRKIDLLTLTESLNTVGKLESAGGAAYLASLLDGVPRISNLRHYVEIVLDAAKARELIHFAESFQQRAFDRTNVPSNLAEQGITELLKISGDNATAVRARPWEEVAKSAVQELVNAKLNPDKAARMFFGLRDLDEMTSGLRRKELCLIVAPTSNGKTLIASQLTVRASVDGFRSLYFSAEMPGEQLAMREIAYRAGVKFYFTQRPQLLSTDELAKLTEAAAEPVNVRIIDQDITPARIWAMAEATKRTSGLDLIVVDYDHLVIEAGIDPKSDEDNVFRQQRAFILGAKKLAERLDICVVILAQLRKVPPNVAKGAQPRLDDIWGDSSIRNTPHLILWVKRDFFEHDMDLQYERTAHVYVLKARNGRTGVVELAFDPERVRFLDAPEFEEVHIP